MTINETKKKMNAKKQKLVCISGQSFNQSLIKPYLFSNVTILSFCLKEKNRNSTRGDKKEH